MKPTNTQYRIMIRGDLSLLKQASVFFDEFSELEHLTAVDFGEGRDGVWRLALYFVERPVSAQVLADLAGFMPVDDLQATLEPIPDIDWVAKVQSDLSPVCAGRFFIHGSHDRALANGHTIAIEIDAGAAFGTAHHGTTLGCLEVLDSLLKHQHPQHVLDLGTGTGILAIAVALQTRKTIIATDIDPVSVEITRRNSVLNGVANQVKVYQGKGFALPVFQQTPKFDLIIANILAKPLMQMSQDIAQHAMNGGYLVLSGILQTQSRHVVATYRNHGFDLLTKITKDRDREGWTTLLMRRV